MNASFARSGRLVVAFLLATSADFALAQRPDSAANVPNGSCGKAEAARRLMEAGGMREGPPVTAAVLEALGETDVLHNSLHIEVTNISPGANTCTITGSNTMTIRSLSPALTEFTFRLRNQFAVSGATINGSTPVTVTTLNTSTRRVTLDRTYTTNEVFTLTIPYTGNTVSVAFGSIEVDTHSGSIPVVATLSEPYYAYTWWPAKDGDVFLPGDNADKATLDFYVTVNSAYSVAANGLLQAVDNLSGNRKRYHWHSDYPMATYLVAFSATQYNTWIATYNYPGGSMPVEFFIYPGNDTPANRTNWENCITMMETLRPLFGEYPFVEEKYGLYNFPFGGGMEHQTMTGQSGFHEQLTSHELGHQWWGDEVTCKTWNHIWVNEGFATYTEALWQEYKPGSSGLTALKSYMSGLKYTGAGSVYVYDSEVDDLFEIFNSSTSYHKGAWVLHMLRHVLGDSEFFAALAEYRAAFAGDAATTEDFRGVCEAHYPGGDLEWFFDQWVYEEGAPSYAWGWTSVQVNGQDYLLVSVDQTQSAAYPRFAMPIDVVADGTTYVVFNDTDVEHFAIPVPSAPATVTFDPDAWVLWAVRTQQAYATGPPKIVETSPPPGVLVKLQSVNTVSIFFTTPVNLSAADVSIVGDASGAQSFTLASGTNANPVVLNLDNPLPVDSFTLTVSDAVVNSTGGLALDGEVMDPDEPGALPSGDGSPGGDAIIRFTTFSSIPTVSSWGVASLALLISIAGTLLLRRSCGLRSSTGLI